MTSSLTFSCNNDSRGRCPFSNTHSSPQDLPWVTRSHSLSLSRSWRIFWFLCSFTPERRKLFILCGYSIKSPTFHHIKTLVHDLLLCVSYLLLFFTVGVLCRQRLDFHRWRRNFTYPQTFFFAASQKPPQIAHKARLKHPPHNPINGLKNIKNTYIYLNDFNGVPWLTPSF